MYGETQVLGNILTGRKSWLQEIRYSKRGVDWKVWKINFAWHMGSIRNLPRKEVMGQCIFFTMVDSEMRGNEIVAAWNGD